LAVVVGALAAIVLVAAVSIFAHALLTQHQPRDFNALSQGADPTPTAGPRADAGSRDLDALAKQKMTRTIVKAPPAPPPKPAAPALNTLIRLTGVMDLGSTKEAIIEIKKSKQSKSYREGAAIEDTGATIKNIQNSVLIDYDSKTFRLSVGGEIEEVKTDPGGSPAAPNSKPVAPVGGKP
jgi:type II secretory pathway component PulC